MTALTVGRTYSQNKFVVENVRAFGFSGSPNGNQVKWFTRVPNLTFVGFISAIKSEAYRFVRDSVVTTETMVSNVDIALLLF